MRIAILTHGENLFGRHYARAFSDRGHEVTLLSMSARAVDVPSVPTRALGPEGFSPRETPSRLPYLKTILPVRRAVRQLAPDILFALYLSSAGVAACLSGHPRVVVSARGSDVLDHVGSPLWRAVFRWEARRAGLVHAVSEPLAQALRDRVGVAPGRILVAPIGVDTRRFALVAPSSRPNAGRIICTRAHAPVYDQATLVRAMARLKKQGVTCHVTFANAYRTEMTQRLVRDHGVEDMATFLPGYRLEELPGLLAQADVYVSCSLSDGTSSSLLEAMSSGLFPVVSDIPANCPWIEDGRSGRLFPPGDDAALAERLAEALAMPERRAAASPINRQTVLERGDLVTETGRMIAAFKKLLKT